MADDVNKQPRQLAASIAVSATESGEVDLLGFQLLGLFVPSNLTGTTLTFKAAANSGGTFGAVRDSSGDPVSIPVTAGEFNAVDPLHFLGVRFLKIVSDANQSGSAASFVVCAGPLFM